MRRQAPVGRQVDFVSRFTPGLMPPALLDAMLVDPKGDVERWVTLLDEGLRAGRMPRILLVGPRGSGKTHAVNVIAHRLRERLGDLAVQWVWLREEEWGVDTYRDLVVCMLRRIEQAEHSPDVGQRLTEIYSLPPAQVEAAAEQALIGFAAGRPMLLLIENLHELFAGLKTSGQQKLRAFLQNHQVAVLATMPALDQTVSQRSFPFFGFFDTYRLHRFTAQDARTLLVFLAELQGDQELVEFLNTPPGLNRVRAVHHLGGGNPRLYVVLAQVLSRQKLDNVVPAVMDLLDELTPYYQSRLAELPPVQRKLVEHLATETPTLLPVKELAKRTFLSPQTAAKELGKLSDRGFVDRLQLGRESLYELCEPLLRYCLQVKAQRGEPVGLIVDFVRHWFTRDELGRELGDLAPEAALARTYLEEALRLGTWDEQLATGRLGAIDWGTALELAELRPELEALCRIEGAAGMLARFEELLSRAPSQPLLLLLKAGLLYDSHRPEEAQRTLELIDRRGWLRGEADLLAAACCLAVGQVREGVALVRSGLQVHRIKFSQAPLRAVVQGLVDTGAPADAAELAVRWSDAQPDEPAAAAIGAMVCALGARPDAYRRLRSRYQRLLRRGSEYSNAPVPASAWLMLTRLDKRFRRLASGSAISELAAGVLDVAASGEEKAASGMGALLLYAAQAGRACELTGALLALLAGKAASPTPDVIHAVQVVHDVAELNGDYQPLLAPLRALLAYLQHGDRRPLYELPSEQRTLFEISLGLREPEPDDA